MAEGRMRGLDSSVRAHPPLLATSFREGEAPSEPPLDVDQEQPCIGRVLARIGSFSTPGGEGGRRPDEGASRRPEAERVKQEDGTDERGLSRSKFVLCPSVRASPNACPAGGHRGPRPRHAGFVGRKRLLVRTVGPRTANQPPAQRASRSPSPAQRAGKGPPDHVVRRPNGPTIRLRLPRGSWIGRSVGPDGTWLDATRGGEYVPVPFYVSRRSRTARPRHDRPREGSQKVAGGRA